MDYVALGLDALTAPHPRDATGALVPVEGPSPLAMIGAAFVGALAVLGIGATLAEREHNRSKQLERWGLDGDSPVPLMGALDKVRDQAAGSKWGMSLRKVQRNLDEAMIVRALATTGGNRTKAAVLLDRSRRWLLYKIGEYGITDARVATEAVAAVTTPVPMTVPGPEGPSAAPAIERAEIAATEAEAAQFARETKRAAARAKVARGKAPPPPMAEEAVDLSAPLFPLKED